MSEPTPALGAVVLAAGASSRLGQPKQLLELDGQTLVERAVLAALAVPALWPVVVVLGAEAARVRPLVARHPVLIVENPAWAEGMASSLRAGLQTLQQFNRNLQAALFLLCDQPGLSAAALQQLLAARAATGASVVASRYAGRLGAPALLDREHFGALAQLTGDEGARQLFSRLPASALTGVDLPALALDVDTPEDLARLSRGEPA